MWCWRIVRCCHLWTPCRTTSCHMQPSRSSHTQAIRFFFTLTRPLSQSVSSLTWTDAECVMEQYFAPSVSLSVCLSVCLSISVCLSVKSCQAQVSRMLWEVVIWKTNNTWHISQSLQHQTVDHGDRRAVKTQQRKTSWTSRAVFRESDMYSGLSRCYVTRWPTCAF